MDVDEPTGSSSARRQKRSSVKAKGDENFGPAKHEPRETPYDYDPNTHLLMEEDVVLNREDPFPWRGSVSWNVDEYVNRIKVDIINEATDGLELEFDLVNVEAPIANALRRVLIAEVPTVAIEKVYLYQNTSCIQDEVLSHRLGLLPVYADPSLFDFPPANERQAMSAGGGISEGGQLNTDYIEEEPAGELHKNLIFELNVQCPTGDQRKKGKTKEKQKLGATSSLGAGSGGEDGPTAPSDAGKDMVKDPVNIGNWTLYSSALKWVPIGEQAELFASDPPRMVHGDIILAKLRPGQEIEARLHCVKGIGRDHAKFSPVATASYRLLPEIRLKKTDIDGEMATRLKSCFSNGVIGIKQDTGRAYVMDSRKDTSSRNVFQHEDLKDSVQMTKKKTHFIFSVESTGATSSRKLVSEACSILEHKAASLREELEAQLETLLKF